MKNSLLDPNVGLDAATHKLNVPRQREHSAPFGNILWSQLGHSGHRDALKPEGSVANDPSSTLAAR
jgi:hypothetical protein